MLLSTHQLWSHLQELLFSQLNYLHIQLRFSHWNILLIFSHSLIVRVHIKQSFLNIILEEELLNSIKIRHLKMILHFHFNLRHNQNSHSTLGHIINTHNKIPIRKHSNIHSYIHNLNITIHTQQHHPDKQDNNNRHKDGI